jgi:hypothetical protein
VAASGSIRIEYIYTIRITVSSINLDAKYISAQFLFSASSRTFDLNGEARTARTKQSSPIIPPA